MEDIIYKRDAIHAVYKEWQGCSKKYGGYDIIYDTTEAIEKIKPAENVKKVTYCKDCKHRSGVTCPMYFEEYYEYDDDGYLENDYIIHDNTTDDGFCERGEREDDDQRREI